MTFPNVWSCCENRSHCSWSKWGHAVLIDYPSLPKLFPNIWKEKRETVCLLESRKPNSIVSLKPLWQRTRSATWQRNDKWKSFDLFILSWEDASVWPEVVVMHEMREMAETRIGTHMPVFFLSSVQGQVHGDIDRAHDLRRKFFL